MYLNCIHVYMYRHSCIEHSLIYIQNQTVKYAKCVDHDCTLDGEGHDIVCVYVCMCMCVCGGGGGGYSSVLWLG